MNRKIVVECLHIFVLVGFAIGQPLFDILGQNPEFFVPHKASPLVIIGLVTGVSVGLPIVFIVFELASSLIGERSRRTTHRLIIFGLSALTALPIGKRLVGGPDYFIWGIAILVGSIFLFAYDRTRPVRMFITVLTPAVVVFPIWFLFFTPVSRLALPQNYDPHINIEISNPVPVVLVVFDEFNLTPLLDDSGKIDEIRFPNFGEFADESWWFPNALAASHTTRTALPAILTGRQPPKVRARTPTANDFPHSLFTLLGNHYHFNVIEAVTALCPEAYCVQDSHSKGLGGIKMLFSDLLIIYLHLIAPPNLANALPPLGAQWAGFGKEWFGSDQVKKRTGGGPPLSQLKAHLERERFLNTFLTHIKKTQNPNLHFLHILLPHITYEFLSSGHIYLPGDGLPFPAGIINDGQGWADEDPLILTAYHRYLHQIGYVDRFLGNLRDSLKSANLYDQALIILTADHGVSIRPGSSRRNINKENAQDILRIPLFVKLPAQREGKISERLVSSLDILPTIIDVLKIKISWNFDGFSLFPKKGVRRTEIAIGSGNHLKVVDLKNFSRLKWQNIHFREHTSLDSLVPKGPFPFLIGKTLSDISIGRPKGMRVFHSQFGRFENVDPESGFLPALFWAHLSETDKQQLPIAIALNGRIWATTQTVAWKGETNYLSVLIPPKAFKVGPNHVQVYLIEKMGETLIPIPVEGGLQDVRVRHDESGNLSISFSDGPPIVVKKRLKSLQAYIGRVIVLRNMLVIDGWAVDTDFPRLAITLLIFSGEHLVSETTPEIPRPDVAKVLKNNELLYSGFRIGVSLDLLTSLGTEVKIVALSGHQRAVELRFTNEQKSFIKEAMMNASIRLQEDQSG